MGRKERRGRTERTRRRAGGRKEENTRRREAERGWEDGREGRGIDIPPRAHSLSSWRAAAGVWAGARAAITSCPSSVTRSHKTLKKLLPRRPPLRLPFQFALGQPWAFSPLPSLASTPPQRPPPAHTPQALPSLQSPLLSANTCAQLPACGLVWLGGVGGQRRRRGERAREVDRERRASSSED